MTNESLKRMEAKVIYPQLGVQENEATALTVNHSWVDACSRTGSQATPVERTWFSDFQIQPRKRENDLKMCTRRSGG